MGSPMSLQAILEQNKGIPSCLDPCIEQVQDFVKQVAQSEELFGTSIR